MAKVGSTYYLYYSVSTFGVQDSAIGVATSTSLDANTWTDRGATGIASSAGKPYNAIDGNLIYDGSKYLMSFGSFWHDLYQVQMKNPPLKTADGATSVNIAYKPEGEHAQEAAFVYRHGSYFYLFFSVGKCCGYDRSRPATGQEYKIQVCRSTSATGGYVSDLNFTTPRAQYLITLDPSLSLTQAIYYDPITNTIQVDQSGRKCTEGGGTTVLQSHGFVYGPGGQGVFNDPSLGPVLYYHYVDTRIGYGDGQKQFGVNRINFASGWPVV